MTTTVTCPNCRQSVRWAADNPYRPFCSRRCKLIDLGEWIEERHGIPGDPEDDVATSGGADEPDPSGY